jgi:hypothetical protein
LSFGGQPRSRVQKFPSWFACFVFLDSTIPRFIFVRLLLFEFPRVFRFRFPAFSISAFVFAFSAFFAVKFPRLSSFRAVESRFVFRTAGLRSAVKGPFPFFLGVLRASVV